MSYDRNEDRVRFTLRLDENLHEALTSEARRQMRSLCAEIKFRLRQTLEHQPDHRTP
jgi:predicted HicB family RNase H-like nuclease